MPSMPARSRPSDLSVSLHLRKRWLNVPIVQSTIQALAEPRRREILRLVRDRELSAGEIASGFDVSRPAISQHLGVLREAGLVSERREGTKRFYRARPEGLEELREFLEGFWAFSLQQLKREAEAEERNKRGSRN
jgi:DNA-binding transcriptional ArsR family regulator